MAGLGDDELAEFGEHEVDGGRRTGVDGGADLLDSEVGLVRTGPVASEQRAQSGLDGCVGLVAGELSDRLPGTLVVDQGFAGGGGSDECGDGGIVQRARQTEAGLVQPSDGIVGDLSRARIMPSSPCPCSSGEGVTLGDVERVGIILARLIESSCRGQEPR